MFSKEIVRGLLAAMGFAANAASVAVGRRHEQRRRLAVALVGLILLLCCGLQVHATEPFFPKVIDLDTTGWDASFARSVNNQGTVAGNVRSADSRFQACLWQNGVRTDLGTMLSGANSELQAINEVGQVFGACWYNGMPGQWGFIITPDNGVYFRDANGDGCNDLMVDIGNLGGATCTSAYDINDNGVAVGLSVAPLNMNYAYRYENGQMYDLNLSTEGCAYGINNRKQIVGQRATGVGTYKAWQWENGVSWLLGELPGGICSQAYAINEAGIAAGWSTTSGNADESMHAVIWDDGPVDLGQLGGQPTIARAINADARVVGSAHSLDYLTESAFLWEGGVMYGLDDLVSESADWRLTRAEDVNDNGWVVGGGINPDGLNHAYLLSTVPEPGSLAMLLGIALTVLLYWCRKRAA